MKYLPSLFLALAAGCAGGGGGGGGGAGGSGLGSSSGSWTLGMAFAASDTGNVFFGLAPFGAHIGGGEGGHLYDCGHPGWDVEFVAGASVRAAADGTVASVLVESLDPSKTTVAIDHGNGYRTNYTNLVAVAVSVGQAVKAGDPLGVAGSQMGWIGSQQVPYSMTHFQLDDLKSSPAHPECSNSFAVSPEGYLGQTGKTVFDQIWATAKYKMELSEPLASLPREKLNPFSITRTLQSKPQGSGLPARIDFIYLDPATDPTPLDIHDDALYDGGGALLESGRVVNDDQASPLSKLDLIPAGSSTPAHLGVYLVIGGTLTIDWGSTVRPSELASAATYTTK